MKYHIALNKGLYLYTYILKCHKLKYCVTDLAISVIKQLKLILVVNFSLTLDKLFLLILYSLLLHDCFYLNDRLK